MALFDFLKRGKRGGAPKQSEDKARRDEIAKEKKAAGREDEQKPLAAIKESRTAWNVLRAPHVTEKSTNLTASNQYTFKVLGNPAKPEIKKSIEEVYGVHVERVCKITLPGKERRRGRRIGWRPGYTKAIATLRQGEKIEVLPH